MKKFLKNVNKLICCLLFMTLVFSFVAVNAEELTDEETNIIINPETTYGNIKILKKDVDTGRPISDVTFKLLDSNQQPARDQDGATVGNVTTDEKGFATFENVAYGTYFISEVATPAGYKSKEGSVKFVLNKNTDALILANSSSLHYMLGDINGDGTVNQEDLSRLTNIVSSNNALDKLTSFVSDLDGDGAVDEFDLAILTAYLNGSSGESSVPEPMSVVYTSNTDSYLTVICQAFSNSSSCNPDELGIDAIAEMIKNETEYSTILSTEYTKIGDDLWQDQNGETINGKPLCPDQVLDADELGYKYQLGDVNGDCVINSDDSALLTTYITNVQPEDSYQFIAGDLDENDVIQQNDVDILNRYVNNKSNSELINSIVGYVDNFDMDDFDGSDDMDEYLSRIGTTGIIPQDIAQSSLLITNEKIILKISKLAKNNNNYLSGATLLIKNASGKVVKKFITQSSYSKINLGAGKYTIVEQTAPDGYVKIKNPIELRIYKDGSVKLLDSSSSLYKITKNSSVDNTLNHLVIYNRSAGDVIKVPDTASNVQVIAIATGLALIIGGGYVLYRRYSKANV